MYFSNPVGGTVIIVYVVTAPHPSISVFSNSLCPHFQNKSHENG